MCGSKKVSMSSFFLNSYFWTLTFSGTMFGPKKVWVPFFLELILFWEPILLLALCLAPKSMNSFFLGTFFLELIHLFVGTVEPWNPYFFWRNVWPEKVWVVPFSGTAPFFLLWFFDEQNIWISQRCLFSRNTWLYKYLCCWIVFVFADKGLHFIGFLSLGDLTFPWACIVSLVHAFWLSGSDFLKD